MSLWNSLTSLFSKHETDVPPEEDIKECDHENMERIPKHEDWEHGLTRDEERFAVSHRIWYSERCPDCGYRSYAPKVDYEESGPVVLFEPDEILESEAEYFEKYGEDDVIDS